MTLFFLDVSLVFCIKMSLVHGIAFSPSSLVIGDGALECYEHAGRRSEIETAGYFCPVHC